MQKLLNGVLVDMTAEEIAEIQALQERGLPEPLQDEISDRQFFQALAIRGIITQQEALAAVKTGDMPAAITGFIAQLPADQQFGASMLLCGATKFNRSHPLTDAFAAMYGMTAEQTDDLWRMAAGL